MRRIVVTLASCPTRLLGPYGCEWVETPTLDRLAAEGVVFDAHYATTPSQSYVGTGLKFDSPNFAEEWKAFAKVESGHLAIEMDSFALPWGDWSEGSLTLTDDNREPFFDAVAGQVNRFDEQFTSLLSALGDNNLLDSCLLIVTAQSGCPVGEHGVLGPSRSRLHEELVHLPLIVRFPDRRLAGYRVPGFTTPADLDGPPEPLILGEWPSREFVVSRRDNEVSLRTAESCLIMPVGESDQPVLLYDRPNDRLEVNNLAPSQPDRVEELKGMLNADSADFRRREE